MQPNITEVMFISILFLFIANKLPIEKQRGRYLTSSLKYEFVNRYPRPSDESIIIIIDAIVHNNLLNLNIMDANNNIIYADTSYGIVHSDPLNAEMLFDVNTPG